MDKRTLLFVVSLSFTLFLVNTFFDYQNRETRKEWHEQQAVKKKQKIRQLESLLKEKSVTAEELPLVTLYGNAEKKNFLTTAVVSGDNILAVAWSEELPDTVYAVANGKSSSYTLASQPSEKGAPVLYYSGERTPLLIGNLPEWGEYGLQLVNLFPTESSAPYSISYAEIGDGKLLIPQESIEALKSELEGGDEEKKTPFHGDAIVLFKREGKYFPVAIYRYKEKKIEFLSKSPAIETKVVKPAKKAAAAAETRGEESYYLLENEYQQLLFSNYGGALLEINLPFQSDDDEKSVVKEIEFDRQIVEKHPYNAHFPAHPYFTPGEKGEGPFVENEKGALGGYYPLIRRDLVEAGKRRSIKIAPKYYATNIVSDYPEVAELVYSVTHFDKNSITFEAMQENRRITKTYTLEGEIAPYTVTLDITIEGNTRGLWLTSGVPEVELISNAPAPALKYRLTKGEKSEVKLIDLPGDIPATVTTQLDWACNSNGFFGLIVDPVSEIEMGYRVQKVDGSAVPTRLVEIGQNHNRFAADSYPGYQIQLPLPLKEGKVRFRLFAGPFSTKILERVDAAYSDSETGYNPDYIACQTFHGWFAFISEPFAKFLLILMNFFHQITGSWAFSIVLLTVALRVMLYPLNAWSTRSMVRMQEITPKVQAVQAKYKNDPKKAQVEMMNVYREAGVNPLSGMGGGCFPLLIQMPFLIGMFDLLKSSFQLRGASFIPGWIDDLAAPDVLFSWETPLPLIGTEFHLLPVFLGLIMFIQPRITSPLPKDKESWTEQQKQQRMMGNMMAVMFTWLFYNFPSGLNIYWASSMLLGMLQQWWNKKNMQPQQKSVEIVVEEPHPDKKKRKKANR